MIKKNCLHCGDEFESRDKRRKFCNRHCSSTYNNIKRGNLYTKYTKEVLEPIVKDSKSITEVLRKLNLKLTSGTHSYISRCIKQKFNLDTSHMTGKGSNKGKVSNNRIPTNEILILFDKSRNKLKTTQLRRAMLEVGIRHECFECGTDSIWQGIHLTLHIHHVNGKYYDNRIENLQFLCPNCHSQTNTYGSKNIMLL